MSSNQSNMQPKNKEASWLQILQQIYKKYQKPIDQMNNNYKSQFRQTPGNYNDMLGQILYKSYNRFAGSMGRGFKRARDKVNISQSLYKHGQVFLHKALLASIGAGLGGLAGYSIPSLFQQSDTLDQVNGFLLGSSLGALLPIILYKKFR